jgi:hypothetical protein
MSLSEQLQVKPLRVSVRQARAMLGGIGKNQIWKLIKDGELEVCGTSSKRWVITESLEAFVARERQMASVERENKALRARAAVRTRAAEATT